MKLIPNRYSLINVNHALRVVKKPKPVIVKFAITSGKLATLEGKVSYESGAAIITGEAGDIWPVERAKFDASYKAVNPTTHGEDGTYQKHPIEVLAIQLTEPTSVNVGYAEDPIPGQVGDWLVQYGEGDFGIVNAEIFANTYEILDQ